MTTMDKLEAMNAFAKVVALGSYAEAGRALGLTRSAVSKGVMELEQLLGARLLDRTTRRVSPTEAGLAYYESCVDILARVEETEHASLALHDEPQGRAQGQRADVVRRAVSRHRGRGLHVRPIPDLKVELTLNDRFIDPIEEGVDVTIRIAASSDSSLIARRLAPARRVLVASPDLHRQHGTPSKPDDLAAHRCLNYGHTTTAAAMATDERRRSDQRADPLAFCAPTTATC